MASNLTEEFNLSNNLTIVPGSPEEYAEGENASYTCNPASLKLEDDVAKNGFDVVCGAAGVWLYPNPMPRCVEATGCLEPALHASVRSDYTARVPYGENLT